MPILPGGFVGQECRRALVGVLGPGGQEQAIRVVGVASAGQACHEFLHGVLAQRSGERHDSLRSIGGGHLIEATARQLADVHAGLVGQIDDVVEDRGLVLIGGEHHLAHRAGASQEQFLDGVAPFDPVPPETARLTVILVASPYRRGASLPGASVGPASIAASVAPPARSSSRPAALSAAVAAASAPPRPPPCPPR